MHQGAHSGKNSPLKGLVKILHIIPDLSRAGAEMKLYKLLLTADRTRFAPIVLSLRNRGELRESIESLGIPVYSLNMQHSLPTPTTVLRLARVVRELSPDLIHGWMYHGNLAAEAASFFVRKKPIVLWSIHQSLYSFDYEKRLTAAVIKLGARLSKRPARIIYISTISALQHEAIGYNHDTALVLYYGFDTGKFAPSEGARRSLRKELNLPEDAFLIGLVGRYHPVKDHQTFVEAAARLVRSHPRTKFVLCGKGVDARNASLNRLIEDANLSEQMHLLGERRDIARIMAALDIATSSSCTEGFPNVIGEAMASGVPCVVTDVSDLKTIVGDTGLVVPPRDPEALASALSELTSLDSATRRALGEAARLRIIQRYSLITVVAEYENVYKQLIRNRQEDPGDPTIATSQLSPENESGLSRDAV